MEREIRPVITIRGPCDLDLEGQGWIRHLATDVRWQARLTDISQSLASSLPSDALHPSVSGTPMSLAFESVVLCAASVNLYDAVPVKPPPRSVHDVSLGSGVTW